MMQYLLTEDEMQAVRVEHDTLKKAVFGERLVALVQHIACTMIETQEPPDEVFSRRGPYPKTDPHGCIHVRDAEKRMTARYCDGCPVAHVCPQYKEWSK